MRQCTCFLVLMGLLLQLTHIGAAALTKDEPEITAETAVLMDAATGQVLYDKNMHTRRHPASITKIMTGMLVLESCSVDETATVSAEAVQIPYNSSHVALSPGEQLPVDSALYALMMPSANDAANVLAEHVAGSQEAFAQRMTRRALELGARNTQFLNPHGLSEEGHYTTAYDMALITRAAIDTPGFLTYYGADRHTIPATNLQSEARPFTNQQYMLLPDMWVYNPEIIGGKVGYTDEARHTMSTAMTHGGRTLIAVVMGCGVDEKFYDTQTLFDYGFDSFTAVQVSAEKQEVPLLDAEGERLGSAVFSPEEDASVLVPAGAGAADLEYRYNLPDSLEERDEAVGSLTVLLTSAGGGSTELVELPLTPMIFHTEQEVMARPSSTKRDRSSGQGGFLFRPWMLAPVGLLGLFILLIVVRNIRIARRRARRMRRQQQIRERYGRIA